MTTSVHTTTTDGRGVRAGPEPESGASQQRERRGWRERTRGGKWDIKSLEILQRKVTSSQHGSVTRYSLLHELIVCVWPKTMYFTNEEYFLTFSDLQLRFNRKIFPRGALHLPWQRYQQHPPAPVTPEGGQRWAKSGERRGLLWAERKERERERWPGGCSAETRD